MENHKSAFISVPLGSGETRSVFVVDISKICYISYKPETTQQTAKLVLDFGASQKILEKQDAEQVYQELVRHPALSRTGNT